MAGVFENDKSVITEKYTAMFGFQLIINGAANRLDSNLETLKRGGVNRCNSIVYKDAECRNYMIPKFENDKIFKEDEEYIVVLDGVITNQRDLMKKYGSEDWCFVIESMYKQNGEVFFNELRGSFAGALYVKAENKWIIYGDQLGSKFIYYTKVGDFFCCSEVMGSMYDLLEENGIQYSMDYTAAKIMLTYGFMIEDYTLCKEVRKLEPGYYMTLSGDALELKQYYQLDNTPDETIIEEQAIEKIDELFSQAIRRNYGKDEEYGYKHLCALSGGLDCRMTTFVSHKLGYTRQLNCTFSQTDYWDETLPKQMAAYLKHEWIFKALDNGMWLYDADEVTRNSGGNVIYYGTAHGNSLTKYVDFESLGMLHSGQLGDVTISTHCLKDNRYKLGTGGYSARFVDGLKIDLHHDYNEEIGLWYYRYLNGTNNGLQNTYHYTESLSPFMDLDFLEYALRIPSRLRYNHQLYKKWVISKYPEAASFVWETTGCRIDARMVRIAGREKPLRQLPMIVLSRLGFGRKGVDSKKHMNPIGYYLSTNKELNEWISGYNKYIDCIEDAELKKDAWTIAKDGTAMEKIQLVTLLSAVRLYYV